MPQTAEIIKNGNGVVKNGKAKNGASTRIRHNKSSFSSVSSDSPPRAASPTFSICES